MADHLCRHLDDRLADHGIDLPGHGYTDDFRAEPDGMRALVAGILYRPELLIVEEVARFEGITDPADEAIVLALNCRGDGVKGTYAVPFGPGMGALDAEMLHRLRGTAPQE